MSFGEIDYTSASFPRNLHEDDAFIPADISWAEDTDYLGQPLADCLKQIYLVPSIHGNKSPVLYSGVSDNGYPAPVFQEQAYENADLSDPNYRLLGLFRLWNCVEYFDPYLDILDENWHDQLSVYIPKMLEGNDQQSYAATLASLSAKLRDAHVHLSPMALYCDDALANTVRLCPCSAWKIDGSQSGDERGLSSPAQRCDPCKGWNCH